jgi:transglutaminase-like putative cysteine protease
MHKAILLLALSCCVVSPLFAQTVPPAVQSPFAELIAAAGNAQDYEGHNTLLVFDSTYVDVDTTGLSHKRYHTLTKILTPEGIAELRAVRFNYDPASNKVAVSRVRVHRGGGTMEELDLGKLMDLPQPADMIYWGARMKTLAVPPLEVGDALEVEYTLTGFAIAYLASDGEEERYIPPMRGTYYDVILFGSNVLEEPTPPIKLKSYTIVMPLSMPAQYETYNGEVMAATLFQDGKLVYRFWKKDVPAYEEETRAPGPSDFVPKVVFTNVKSWAEKSRWFYNVNENAHVFQWNDDIKREVDRITAGCRTDTCKFYALLHWVAQSIRYSGISMGEGEGYTLHPGIMTFHDRAGVCKDIAGMLVTMLRAAGFTTYPVMTMAGARVERIPADQFNHCVVAVPRPDGTFLMLDPTWSPFNMELWSRAESEQNIVVGSPRGEDLSHIEKFTPQENDFSITVRSRLDEQGNLSGTVVLSGKSYGDARARREFSDNGQDRWDQIVRKRLTTADPAAELVKVTYGDLWDFYHPFTVTIEFRVPGYARVVGKRMDYVPFSSKFMWAGAYQHNLPTGLTEKRTEPVFTYNPRQITLRETVQLPPGFSVRKLAADRDAGGEIAHLKSTWKKVGSTVELNQTWRMRDRWIPVKDYPEVWKVFSALKKSDDLAVTFEKGGAR